MCLRENSAGQRQLQIQYMSLILRGSSDKSRAILQTERVVEKRAEEPIR